MMKLFRKKPAVWYVLKPARVGQPYEKLGPFERSSIATMYKNGQLGEGALVWTNERIFANPKKPNSSRTVRLGDWKRFDELPDPTQQQIIALAQNPEPQHVEPTQHQSVGGNESSDMENDEIPPPVPPPSDGGYSAPSQAAPGGYPVQAPGAGYAAQGPSGGGYMTPSVTSVPASGHGGGGYPPQGPSAGGYMTPSGPGIGGHPAQMQQPYSVPSAQPVGSYGPPMHKPYPTQQQPPAQPHHPAYPQPPPGYPSGGQ